MPEKTHYRKAFNSPYLSAADIVEPVILTISHVTLGKDETKKTKDKFNTAHFVEREIRRGEPLKPMILNVRNSRAVKDFTSSPYIEDWKNVLIEVYVDKNVKFGRDTVEGLRINKIQPKAKFPAFNISTQLDNAVVAYKRDGNFEKIEARYTMTDADKEAIKTASEVA